MNREGFAVNETFARLGHLYLGPLDGAKLYLPDGLTPNVVYASRDCNRDGYAGWSKHWSEDHPLCYVRAEGFKYRYKGSHEYRR